jgi:general secretion pathway protein E
LKKKTLFINNFLQANSMPTTPPPKAKAPAKLTGQVRITDEFVQSLKTQVQTLEQLKTRLEQAQQTGVTEIIQVLLVSALVLDASDIHIEPEANGILLRLRIDGILHDVLTFPRSLYEPLLSRLKLTSGTKINITDKPQDGRFSFSLGSSIVEARVSILPAEYGESFVLRVLNPKNLITLPELGFRKDILQKPNGMVLATGPTGSGKTTTLYAFLKKIERPEIKIITIEDPIEYHLDGVSQTQVNPERGYDFTSGLQAIVRQDPDVILVGEVRNKDTTQIALQAALTGHLVFSTLHTNDAPGTISRLQSLKAKALNIGAATNLIIGQRLVRKVCSQCSVSEKGTAQEIAKLKQGLQGITTGEANKLSVSLQLPRAKGCPTCNNTGYKGRTGIFEVIFVDPVFEEFILTKPSTSALRQFAIKQGMVPMYQDGLLKVMQGITTLEEISRVTGE